MTRQDYLARFPSTSDAIEFETQVLSIGEDLLPACAIAVKANRNPLWEPPSSYWAFLCLEVDAMSDEGLTPDEVDGEATDHFYEEWRDRQ